MSLTRVFVLRSQHVMSHCIHINPVTRIITHQKMPLTLQALQELVAFPPTWITVGLQLPNNDILYVQEDICDVTAKHRFKIEGHEFIGNAVVVSINADGDNCSPRSSIEHITQNVSFV